MGGWVVIAKGYRISIWSNENVLRLTVVREWQQQDGQQRCASVISHPPQWQLSTHPQSASVGAVGSSRRLKLRCSPRRRSCFERMPPNRPTSLSPHLAYSLWAKRMGHSKWLQPGLRIYQRDVTLTHHVMYSNGRPAMSTGNGSPTDPPSPSTDTSSTSYSSPTHLPSDPVADSPCPLPRVPRVSLRRQLVSLRTKQPESAGLPGPALGKAKGKLWAHNLALQDPEVAHKLKNVPQDGASMQVNPLKPQEILRIPSRDDKNFPPEAGQWRLEEVTAPADVKTATQDFEECEKSRKHDTTKRTQ